MTTNCKLAVADLLAQPSNDRNELLALDQIFRQRFPPTPLIGPEQTNWTSGQINIDKVGEKSSLTIGQNYGDTRPNSFYTATSNFHER